MGAQKKKFAMIIAATRIINGSTVTVISMCAISTIASVKTGTF